MTILNSNELSTHQLQQKSTSDTPSISPALSPGRHRRDTECRALRIRSRFGLILLALVASLGLAPSAWSVATPHPAEQYVEGDAIVTFKPSTDLSGAQQVLQGHSLQFSKHFAFLSQQRSRHSGLVRASDRTTAQLIAELSSDPDVELAEPNYLRWISSSVPTDALFSQLWGLQNTGQSVNETAGTAGDDIKFVSAWSLAQTSATPVVVAVVDTGVD